MLELILAFLSVSFLSKRAQQRRRDPGLMIALAGGGFAVFLILGIVGLGISAFFLRWAWLGGLYVYVETAGEGTPDGMTWKCPDCTALNDPGAAACLCGYEQPTETAAG